MSYSSKIGKEASGSFYPRSLPVRAISPSSFSPRPAMASSPRDTYSSSSSSMAPAPRRTTRGASAPLPTIDHSTSFKVPPPVPGIYSTIFSVEEGSEHLATAVSNRKLFDNVTPENFRQFLNGWMMQYVVYFEGLGLSGFLTAENSPIVFALSFLDRSNFNRLCEDCTAIMNHFIKLQKTDWSNTRVEVIRLCFDLRLPFRSKAYGDGTRRYNNFITRWFNQWNISTAVSYLLSYGLDNFVKFFNFDQIFDGFEGEKLRIVEELVRAALFEKKNELVFQLLTIATRNSDVEILRAIFRVSDEVEIPIRLSDKTDYPAHSIDPYPIPTLIGYAIYWGNRGKISTRREYSSTPLDVNIIDELIIRGDNIYADYGNGKTLLMAALEKGMNEISLRLISMGLTKDFTFEQDESNSLILSAIKGTVDDEVFKALLPFVDLERQYASVPWFSYYRLPFEYGDLKLDGTITEIMGQVADFIINEEGVTETLHIIDMINDYRK